MNLNKASACVVAAGILWGCISLFTQALGSAGLASVQITCVRMVVGTVGMLAVVLLRNPQKLRIRLRDAWLFIGTGVMSVALFNLLYFSCMEASGVSVAVVLLYTSPAFVMLMGAMLFRERITARKLLALAMTMAGSVLVAGLLGGPVRLSPQVMLMGVGSGFFYALYSIFARVALRRYDTFTVTFYTFLCGAAALVPLSDAPGMARVFLADPAAGLWGVGIGVVCTVAPYVLYTLGLAHMDAGRAAILAMVEPLVGTFIGIAVFHEPLGALKAAGIVLIFAAVALLNLPARERLGRDFG